MEVNESATTVTYKIDDRMGPWMDVHRWIDEQGVNDLAVTLVSVGSHMAVRVNPQFTSSPTYLRQPCAIPAVYKEILWFTSHPQIGFTT